ncbi:hypothetical protein WA026_001509 [Henosepilachna vigintioctopunctata]|uniref:Uncharacterized protein n=1 Tax=Henosepilachna vigintioctopunctata TaxID=420089 RepID=A0AAW1UIH8_9CUCU
MWIYKYLGRTSQMPMCQILKISYTTQFAALRVVKSHMRCSPTNLILVETGQLPLKYRRLLFAFKFISTALRIQAHSVLSLLQYRKEFDHLWFNNNIPPILEALVGFQDNRKWILQATRLLLYLQDAEERISKK